MYDHDEHAQYFTVGVLCSAHALYLMPTHNTQAHHGRINALAVAPPTPHRRVALEVCTASADGSCVVWDVHSGAQLAMLRSPTNFGGVVYHPNGCQLVTIGARRVGPAKHNAECCVLHAQVHTPKSGAHTIAHCCYSQAATGR